MSVLDHMLGCWDYDEGGRTQEEHNNWQELNYWNDRGFSYLNGRSSLVDDQQYCYGRPCIGKWLPKNIYFAKKDFNNIENNEERCKMAKKAKRTGTTVLTGELRLSYCHLFQPYGIDGNEPKYSTAVLIPKTAKDTIKAIKEAIGEAKEQGKSKFKGGRIPANLKTPLREETRRDLFIEYVSCRSRPTPAQRPEGVLCYVQKLWQGHPVACGLGIQCRALQNSRKQEKVPQEYLAEEN